jgi:hypothetical protein
MMFIESKAVQNNILSDSEESAILSEVRAEYPCADHFEIVNGGVMVFDTYDEYLTWAD